MKSSDGKFEVVCSDFMEVRMGSPLFGTIEVRGLKRRFDGRLFGEAMAFSPDSRFFAVAELIDDGQHPYGETTLSWSAPKDA